MKTGKTIVLVLIAVTAAGCFGTVRNLARITDDKETAHRTAAAAREIFHAATRDEAEWTLKVDSFRKLVLELEQQVPGDDPEVSVSGAELQTSARRLGLEISRLDSDPTRGIVSMAVTGPEAAACQWLQDVESAMHRDGGLLEHLVVTAEPADQMAVAIEIRYARRDESAPNPAGLSRMRLLEATQTWPAATVQTVTAAFVGQAGGNGPDPGLPSAEEYPTVGERPAYATPHQADLPAGRVELVGIASVNGVTHYALRFSEERSVRTLKVGQEAFGWQLLDAGDPNIVLQKEGEYYAIPQ